MTDKICGIVESSTDTICFACLKTVIYYLVVDEAFELIECHTKTGLKQASFIIYNKSPSKEDFNPLKKIELKLQKEARCANGYWENLYLGNQKAANIDDTRRMYEMIRIALSMSTKLHSKITYRRTNHRQK